MTEPYVFVEKRNESKEKQFEVVFDRPEGEFTGSNRFVIGVTVRGDPKDQDITLSVVDNMGGHLPYITLDMPLSCLDFWNTVWAEVKKHLE
jgi:hypothetical protein